MVVFRQGDCFADPLDCFKIFSSLNGKLCFFGIQILNTVSVYLGRADAGC